MSDHLTTLSWQAATTPVELQGVLRALAAEYPLREGGEGMTVRFEKTAAAGECVVTRQGGEAVIRYDLPMMALRAVGALLGGMVGEGETLTESSPFTTFGIMLDCSRNMVMTVEHFKAWLRRLTLLGYNMAMLYTEDTYELPGEEFFGYGRGAYTAEELREIDDYAAGLGIEMIGCIQTLGHLSQILKWVAYKEVKDTPDILLVDEEKSYALIEKMIAHFAETYRSRRLHIGMDEAHNLGLGRFLDRHGYERKFDIFNRHLAKVVALCEKYGVKPMIWSDMYFRMGSKTGDYYDLDCVIPEDVKNAIPPQAELVYWDYYHADKAFYLDWIQRHRDLGFEPLMGSGVWTWGQFWHNYRLTENNGGPCIDACREAGLKEVFFTLWGDDGGYCDFDSALSGLAYVAEKAYTGDVNEARLAQRFQAACGADYAMVRLAGNLHTSVLDAPIILWDDPVLAVYLHNVVAKWNVSLSEVAGHFRELTEQLHPHRAERAAGNIDHANLLAVALAAKLDLAAALFDAYRQKDMGKLRSVRAQIPAVEKAISDVAASFRALWLSGSKPFGLEVMQIRLAGQLARYQELATRLDEYLSGQIDTIPELDLNLNPPTGHANTYKYHLAATPSSIL